MKIMLCAASVLSVGENNEARGPGPLRIAVCIRRLFQNRSAVHCKFTRR